MKQRNLGSQGLVVSELGFGCMNLSWAYGPATDEGAAIALIRAAYDRGVRLFDTAEAYGPRDNERIVGKALKDVRDDVVITADARGATTGQIALAWLLARRPFIVPIPGTTKLAHLEENIAAADFVMTEADMIAIEEGFAKIEVQGARSSEQQLENIDRGAKLGTRSLEPAA